MWQIRSGFMSGLPSLALGTKNNRRASDARKAGFGGKRLELFRFATAGKRSKTAALCTPLFYRPEKFPSSPPDRLGAKQQTFANTLPNGRVESIVGVGHGVNLLQPERCAAGFG